MMMVRLLPSSSDWEIVRDMLLVGVGGFLLVYEALHEGRPQMITAAVALLASAPAIRLDSLRKRTEKSNGKGDRE